MSVRSLKSSLVVVFSVCMLLFSNVSFAQPEGHGDEHKTEGKKEKFNAAKVIFDHILDNHEFHFFDIPSKDGTKHPVSLPFPVILIRRKED